MGTMLAKQPVLDFLWPMLPIIPGAMAVTAAATSDEPEEDH
jgi:hypothetical protein